MAALSPALANNGPLDYNDQGDRKIYHKAISPLSPGEPYDLNAADLTTFLLDVDNRAVEYGFEAILSIPDDVNAPNPTLRLMTTDYGRITLQQVADHVNTYINNGDRDSQNAFMLYICLWSSLTTSAKKKLNLQRSKFFINGNGVGPLLLKVIIQTAYVDTRSTTMQLRDNLSSLDTYMREIKSDVDMFNDYVRTNLEGLAARGEQSLDVVTNLFKGYASVSDHQFLDFIKRKKDAYQEESIDLTPEDLMMQASNKYNALKAASQWNKATPEQEKIIALETQLAQIKKQHKTPKPAHKFDKGKADQSKNKKQPNWLRTAPKDGEGETKRFNDRTFYWCGKHKRWSLNPNHTTSSCKEINLNGKEKDGNKRGNEPKHGGAKDKKDDGEPTIRLAKALTSVSKQE